MKERFIPFCERNAHREYLGLAFRAVFFFYFRNIAALSLRKWTLEIVVTRSFRKTFDEQDVRIEFLETTRIRKVLIVHPQRASSGFVQDGQIR